MALAVFLMVAWGVFSQAGDPACVVPASCSDLQIEMIRFDDPINTCDGDDNSCTDRFYQRSYKVYLKMTLPSAPPASNPFVSLNYQQMFVRVPFKSLTTTPGGVPLSRINAKDTRNCFASEHANWYNFDNSNGDKVIFEVDEASQMVSVQFYANPSDPLNTCGASIGNTNNTIVFDFSTHPPIGGAQGPGVWMANCMGGVPPSSAVGTCAYVELFSIVVDAYPDETMRLEVPTAIYTPKPGSMGPNCDPLGGGVQIGSILGGNYNAGITTTPVPLPISSSSTPNANLLLDFGPVVVPANSEYRSVDLILKNTGTNDITVDYAEFVLSTTVNGDQVPLTIYDGSTVESTHTLTNNVSKKIYIKARLDGVSIPAGGQITLRKASYGPSQVMSSQWTAGLNYYEESTKFRVKTPQACTNLAGAADLSFTVPGAVLCSNPNIQVTLEATEPSCSRYNIRLKVKNTHSLDQYRVGGFAFGLVVYSSAFAGSGLTIVDPELNNGFSSWPWPHDEALTSCNTLGCGGPNYCIPSLPWSFNYCFRLPTALGAPVLQAGQEIFMDIPVEHGSGTCLYDVAMTSLSINFIEIVNGTPVIGAPCFPSYHDATNLPLCESGTLVKDIAGHITADKPDGQIEDAEITIKGQTCPSCNIPLVYSDINGDYSSCNVCLGCGIVTVTPSLDIDPRNGVDTWDLILINRHILGLEPLNTPYKLISADANKSKTVTILDIIELRKLILGTYQQLPDVKSWRFVDANQVFSNPENPFADVIKEDIEVSSTPVSGVDFIGCKIGDVDLTAKTHNKPNRPIQNITWETVRAKGPKTLTVPIRYNGDMPIEALQFALRFDTATLALISPSAGEVTGVVADNFGLARVQDGILGFSWNLLDPIMNQPIQEGQVLFYLTFAIKRDLPEQGPLFSLCPDAVPDGAWTSDGTAYALQGEEKILAPRESAPLDTANSVTVSPNPTEGAVYFGIQTAQGGKALFAVSDAFGQTLVFRELHLDKGTHTLPLPELAQKPAGVYTYTFKLPNGSILSGHIVKQ